jgi:hypothetical protein
MKTKIFFIAITAVLSLSTLNVHADGTKGKKQSARINNATVTHIIKSFKEVEMEMESWMTSFSEFNSNTEILIDEPMQLEDWMMSDFNNNSNTENFQDDELVLESWMMNDFNENNNTKKFQDDELPVEGWMLESLDLRNQEISAW